MTAIMSFRAIVNRARDRIVARLAVGLSLMLAAYLLFAVVLFASEKVPGGVLGNLVWPAIGYVGVSAVVLAGLWVTCLSRHSRVSVSFWAAGAIYIVMGIVTTAFSDTGFGVFGWLTWPILAFLMLGCYIPSGGCVGF